MKNILILCTGNSARSILGEALINYHGKGRFCGYSAGSFPKGAVHPGAIAVLERNGISGDGFRSKSWNEFTSDHAPALDIVITVCDNAAGETCPIFLGKQIKAHWGIDDPADATGDAAIVAAFDKAFAQMTARVTALCALDIAALEKSELQQALNVIGQMEGATKEA